MTNTILPKDIRTILKKALAAFVTGVFLFNDIAFAADFQNLAPRAGLTLQEFRDRYLAGYILLSHKAVNSYIETYLSTEDAELIRLIQADIRLVKVKVRHNGKQETIDVRIVPIRKMQKNTKLSKGFLASTGQLAHIGLGNAKDKETGKTIGCPSVYIDYNYRYDPDLLANELEKIVKWEEKKRELGKTYGQMRQWMQSNPKDARALAAQFHSSSRSIRHLYDEVKKRYRIALNADNLEECQKILDFDVMCEYFDKFGLDEGSNDANLAASPAPDAADSNRGIGRRQNKETQESWERHYALGRDSTRQDDDIWNKNLRDWVLKFAAEKNERTGMPVPILIVGGADMRHAADLRRMLPEKEFPITVVDFVAKNAISVPDGISYISSKVEELNPSVIGQRPELVLCVRTLEYTDREKALGQLKKIVAPAADFIFIIHHPLSPFLYKTKMDLVKWRLYQLSHELAIRLLKGLSDESSCRRALQHRFDRLTKEFVEKSKINSRFKNIFDTAGGIDGIHRKIFGVLDRESQVLAENDRGAVAHEIAHLSERIDWIRSEYADYKAQYGRVLKVLSTLHGTSHAPEEMTRFFSRQGFDIVQNFGLWPDDENAFFFFHLRDRNESTGIDNGSARRIQNLARLMSVGSTDTVDFTRIFSEFLEEDFDWSDDERDYIRTLSWVLNAEPFNLLQWEEPWAKLIEERAMKIQTEAMAITALYPHGYSSGDTAAQLRVRSCIDTIYRLAAALLILNRKNSADRSFDEAERLTCLIQSSETGLLPVQLQRELVLWYLRRQDILGFVRNLRMYLTGDGIPLCTGLDEETRLYQIHYMKRLAYETLSELEEEFHDVFRRLPAASKKERMQELYLEADALFKAARENPFVYPLRVSIPEEFKSPSITYPTYNPPYYVDREVLMNDRPGGYADPEDINKVPRPFASFEGQLSYDKDGYPVNPVERTGLRGRGVLGHWGANFAVDFIVTTEGENGEILFLSVKRADAGRWSIPGGMLGFSKNVFMTAEQHIEQKTGLKISAHGSSILYKGYVKDGRNTDNAWMETVVLHRHISKEEMRKLPDPKTHSSYVRDAQWISLKPDLFSSFYANHGDFIAKAYERVTATRRGSATGGPVIGPVLLFMAVPSWIAIAKSCVAGIFGMFHDGLLNFLADEDGGIGRRKERKFYTMPQKVRDAWDELREADRSHREVMVTIVGINYSYGKDHEGKKIRVTPSGFKVQFATSKGGVIAGFAHGDRTGLDFSRMSEEELKKYIPRKVMAKIISCGNPGGKDPEFSFRIVEESKIELSKVQKFDDSPDTAKSRTAERAAREHEEERAGLQEKYKERAKELAAQRQAEAEDRRARVNPLLDRKEGSGDPTILGEGSRVIPRAEHEKKQERLKGQIEEIASALDEVCEKLLNVSHAISKIGRYRKGPGEWFFDMRLAAQEILANRGRISPNGNIEFDAHARNRFMLRVGFGASARDVIFEMKHIFVDPVESYSILEIIDPAFNINHAGRNALTIYAKTQRKAVHELTELRHWIKFARRNGIASRADIEGRELGYKIRFWANTAPRNILEETTQLAHDYACLNELEFILNRKASSDMIELAKKKLFVDTDGRGALKFISDTDAELDITDSDNEWELDVSPDGKTIRISEACLENRSPEFIEHRITHYVDYRNRLYDIMVNDPELLQSYERDPALYDWIAKLLCEHMWLEAIARDGRDGALAVSDLWSLYSGESEAAAKKNDFPYDFWIRFIEASYENITMVPVKAVGLEIGPDEKKEAEFLREKLEQNLSEMPYISSEIEDGVEVDAPILADTKPESDKGAAAADKAAPKGLPHEVLGISERLKQAGRYKLNGLNIKQAVGVIGASYRGLFLYLHKHPEDFKRYGIKRPRTRISTLLTLYGRARLRGLNLTQVADITGLSIGGLLGYFSDHPEDLDKYEVTIESRSKDIPGKLKLFGKEKLQGLNISQAAELIGVSSRGLSGHLWMHPGDFKKYGLKKGRDTASYETVIPGLLESFGRNRLRRLNLSQAADLMSVSLGGLSYHLKHHPEDLIKYEIVLQPRPKDIPGRLKSFGKEKLQGMSINQAAELIGVSTRGLRLHLRNYPEDFKRYGLITAEETRKDVSKGDAPRSAKRTVPPTDSRRYNMEPRLEEKPNTENIAVGTHGEEKRPQPNELVPVSETAPAEGAAAADGTKAAEGESAKRRSSSGKAKDTSDGEKISPELIAEDQIRMKILKLSDDNTFFKQSLKSTRILYDLSGQKIGEFNTRIPKKAELATLHKTTGDFYLLTRFSQNRKHGGCFIQVYREADGNFKKFHFLSLPPSYYTKPVLVKIGESGVVTDIWLIRAGALFNPAITIVSDAKSRLIDSFFGLHVSTALSLRAKYGDLIVRKRVVLNRRAKDLRQCDFSVASKTRPVAINVFNLPASANGKIAQAEIGDNAVVTRLKVDEEEIPLVKIYSPQGKLILTRQSIAVKVSNRLAKMYGGIDYRLRVPEKSRLLTVLGKRYFLPEYRGREIAISYDQFGNRTKLHLPARLTSPAVTLDISNNPFEFHYMSPNPKMIQKLKREVKNPLLTRNRDKIRNLFASLTTDPETVEYLLAMIPQEELSQEATQWLLDLTKKADDAMYRRAGKAPHLQGGRRIIGAEHEELLKLYSLSLYRRNMRLRGKSPDLDIWERRRLTETVTCGLQAQNILWEYNIPIILQVLARSNSLKNLRKQCAAEPDRLLEWVTVGYDGLRKAIWSYDASLGIPFSVWANIKVRSALLDEARKESIDNHMGSRTNPKRAKHIYSLDSKTPDAEDNLLQILKAPETNSSRLEENDLWERILMGFDERERTILTGVFIYGQQKNEIADRLGCDPSRISQLFPDVLKRLSQMKDKMALLREFLEIDDDSLLWQELIKNGGTLEKLGTGVEISQRAKGGAKGAIPAGDALQETPAAESDAGLSPKGPPPDRMIPETDAQAKTDFETLKHNIETFFNEGYWIDFGMAPDEDDFNMKEDELLKIKYSRWAGIWARVHNRDRSKFVNGASSGHVQIGPFNDGKLRIKSIEPSLPKGKGRIFMAAALTMLYGRDNPPLNFKIMTNEYLSKSFSRLPAEFRIESGPLKTASGKDAYDVRGIVPPVDAETIAKWKRMNDANREGVLPAKERRGEAENAGVQNEKSPVVAQEASKGIPIQLPSLLAMMGVQDAILPAETFRDPHPYHSKVADVLDGGDPLQGAYLGVVYPERDEALAGSWKFDAANLRKLTGELGNGMLIPEARLGGFGFESWNTLDLTHNLPPYESSTLGADHVAGGDNADDTAAVFQSSHKITPTIGLAENIVSSSTASQDKGVVETRLLNLIRTDAMPGDVADVNNIPIERVDSHQMPYVDTSIHVYTKDVNSNVKISVLKDSVTPRIENPAEGAAAADNGAFRIDTPQKSQRTLSNTAGSVSGPHAAASTVSTYEFDASRKAFLRALHTLNKYWWFIQDPQNGYYDKTALGFDLGTHTPVESIISGWSDYEFNGRGNNDSKLKIFGRIIRDRIAKGYLVGLSYEDAIELFSLLRLLGINTNHISLTDGEWRVATLDNILNVAVFSRVGQLIPQEENALTTISGLLPQETMLIQINSLDAWKKILEYKQTLSGSIAIAESGASNYLYFLDFYASPAVILHEIIHILATMGPLQKVPGSNAENTESGEVAPRETDPIGVVLEAIGRDITKRQAEAEDAAEKIEFLRGKLERNLAKTPLAGPELDDSTEVDAPIFADTKPAPASSAAEVAAPEGTEMETSPEGSVTVEAMDINIKGEDMLVAEYFNRATGRALSDLCHRACLDLPQKPLPFGDVKLHPDITPRLCKNRRNLVLFFIFECWKNIKNHVPTYVDSSLRVERVRRNDGVLGIRIISRDAGAGMSIEDVFGHPKVKAFKVGRETVFESVFLASLKEFAMRTDGVIVEAASKGVRTRFYFDGSGPKEESQVYEQRGTNETTITITVFSSTNPPLVTPAPANPGKDAALKGATSGTLSESRLDVSPGAPEERTGLSSEMKTSLETVQNTEPERENDRRVSATGAVAIEQMPIVMAQPELIAEPFTATSPAEWLKGLNENDALLKAARSEEGVAVPSGAKILEELEVVEIASAASRPRNDENRYRFTSIMRGADADYTMAMINLVDDVMKKFEKFTKESPGFIKEMIRAYMVDYVYGKVTVPEGAEEAQTIRIWQGYGAKRQQKMMRDVATKTNDRIKFEKDIDELIGFAVRPENINKGTVTILPRQKLNPGQKTMLTEAVNNGAQIIYIDLNKENLLADELGQIEGLVGVGRSYLNNDEESFYRFYNLLAEKPVADRALLDELKKNPDLFIDQLKFVLRPIKAHNLNDLPRINRELKKLLESA